jgi:predicted transcriptional regulator of viral defense system
MTFYDEIYEVAADNYGIITSAQAKNLGISDKEMSRMAHDGRLRRLGHGVYKVKHHTPTPFDPYAEAVMRVGPGACLFGETVIAMHGLAPTNPAYVYIATPSRIRKTLPSYIRIIHQDNSQKTTQYEGIPSQAIPDAILSSRGRIMTERLEAATLEARRKGLITKREEETLLLELGK